MNYKSKVNRIQESKKATNIYISWSVALNLAMQLIKAVFDDAVVVRIVVRNKDTNPDIGAHSYKKKSE